MDLRRHAHGLLVALFSFWVFAASPAFAQTQVWDLEADWSTTQNPNGPWSYRAGTSALPYLADWAGLPAWAHTNVGVGHIPVWLQVRNGFGGLRDGAIFVHAWDRFNGDGLGAANVLWTSPIQGQIDITGSVFDLTLNRPAFWSLSVDGTVITRGEILNPSIYTEATPFRFEDGLGGPAALSHVAVNIGSQVVWQYDVTGPSVAGPQAVVGMTIAAVPEPAVAIQLLLGLPLVALCTRRFWRAGRRR